MNDEVEGMPEEPQHKTVAELISDVDHFMSIHNWLEDDDLDMALSYVVKLMQKPDVPPATAYKVIIRLQAISAKMQMSASILSHGPDKDPKKKNVYYSAYKAIDKLVDALKYAANAGKRF